MHTKLRIYSDGGSRGNPGPSAIAYIILTENNQIITKNSCYIGLHTNNQAEYEALNAALEQATSLKAEEVTCHLDSELVTKHLTGEYKVKNPQLEKLWRKTKQLTQNFKKIVFVNVPRENRYIQQADKLVNEALDTATKK